MRSGLLLTLVILKMKELKVRFNVYNERIASADASKQSIVLEIERVKKEQKRLSDELTEKSSLMDNIDKKLSDEKKKESKLKDEADKIDSELTGTEESIEKAKGDIIDFINEGGETREKVARYDAMLENINLRKTELNSIMLQNKSDEIKEKSEKERLELGLNSVEDKISEYNRKLDKSEENLREKTDKYNSVKQDINKHNQDIISLKSRYESLRNLTERYEGYGVSIKKGNGEEDRKKRYSRRCCGYYQG